MTRKAGLLAEGRLAPGDWESLRSALLADELLIYPTDTLYALGGLALREVAANRVRAAKQREVEKPLGLVLADIDQVGLVCAGLTEVASALARAFWPGPLTLVVASAANVPGAVTAGTGTVAIRVPDREVTRRLCALAGPLVATSANVAGGPPPRRLEDAVEAVGLAAAFVVDGGDGRAVPSTIIDATLEAPRLVRAGAIPWDAALRLLSERRPRS